MPEVEINKNNKTLTVALAGNPNSGKTTVFNALTKLRQKVGNYAGVTVEKKSGQMAFSDGSVATVLDLPGTYSLAVRSPDEKVARDVLMGRLKDTAKPDIVVCVIDAGNLERNLYLVSQIKDLGLNVIIALNMMDELKKKGATIEIDKLAKLLNAPVVGMVANKNKGIEELKQALINFKQIPYQRQWIMPQPVEKEIKTLTDKLKGQYGLDPNSAFSEALILMSFAGSQDELIMAHNKEMGYDSEILKDAEDCYFRLTEKSIRCRSVIIESRYSWLKSVVKQAVVQGRQQNNNITNRLDSVLTHKIFGWMAFLLLMGFMFFMIFSIATYPMDWIDGVFNGLSSYLKQNMPAGDLRDLLTDGVIAGVGGVVIFLPQILILFLFISLLQDTGYMARAAFIMDRVMNKFGLHGKSFIPLLSSFACAIPGIMAARTIENRKDRLVTILVAPLMSCSARLPVYTVMIAVLIPETTAFQKASIMMALYMLGMIGACVMAWLFKSTLLKGEKPVFIMELPPYRAPSLKTVLLHMWERSRLFIKRAGTVILAMSVILWALMSYPKNNSLDASENLKLSYAGKMGKMIEPAIKPLGYDWRIGIGLIGSFAAREVFVSTMNIVFNLDEEADTDSLRDAFSQARWPDGKPLFTPLVCVSLMVFFVFAMQCLSTIAVVWRETNGWFWPLFQLVYMSGLAYVLAFLIFQVGRFLGL